MYGIDGDVPAEDVLPHLSGWRGVGPVSVGNAAAGQTQHDIYGELLLALECYLDANGAPALPSMRSGLAELIGNLAERAMEHAASPTRASGRFGASRSTSCIPRP